MNINELLSYNLNIQNAIETLNCGWGYSILYVLGFFLIGRPAIQKGLIGKDDWSGDERILLIFFSFIYPLVVVVMLLCYFPSMMYNLNKKEKTNESSRKSR